MNPLATQNEKAMRVLHAEMLSLMRIEDLSKKTLYLRYAIAILCTDMMVWIRR